MTYEEFVAYSTIAIGLLFVILVFYLQNKEMKREEEIKKRFKEFDKKIEEIRRRNKVSKGDDNLN